jgi:PAS domain-containing protein
VAHSATLSLRHCDSAIAPVGSQVHLDEPFLLEGSSLSLENTPSSMGTGNTMVIVNDTHYQSNVIESPIGKAGPDALRESEDRYRQLFEGNPLPSWVYDLETLRFLTVNQAAVRCYGYAREEFLTMTIKDIVHRKTFPHRSIAFPA